MISTTTYDTYFTLNIITFKNVVTQQYLDTFGPTHSIVIEKWISTLDSYLFDKFQNRCSNFTVILLKNYYNTSKMVYPLFGWFIYIYLWRNCFLNGDTFSLYCIEIKMKYLILYCLTIRKKNDQSKWHQITEESWQLALANEYCRKKTKIRYWFRG